MNFRIYRKSDKEFLPGDSYFVNATGNIFSVGFLGGVYPEDENDLSIQRSTGLFDLYGTPIFEGDLVKLYYHHANIIANEYEIKYIRGRWMLDEEKSLTELWFDNKKFGDCCKVVIVGNIYDKDR